MASLKAGFQRFASFVGLPRKRYRASNRQVWFEVGFSISASSRRTRGSISSASRRYRASIAPLPWRIASQCPQVVDVFVFIGPPLRPSSDFTWFLGLCRSALLRHELSLLFHSETDNSLLKAIRAECPKESRSTDAINVYFFAVENLSALRR